MNYNEFVNTYMGKAIDYDGVSGVQCVDLIKQYLDSVFDIKPGAWGNAKDYYLNFNSIPQLRSNFTRIANTPWLVPQKGDIVVWGCAVGGGYGHISIATGVGNTSQFNSYDQNWNGKAMHEVLHNYRGFLGVLRPDDQSKINALYYRSHVQDEGWQGYVPAGAISGTTGQCKQIEAICVSSSEIEYRVHMMDKGWGEWCTNNAVAGTTGENRRIEAIEFRSNRKISAQGHVQNIGWQKAVDGYDIIIGTTGRSLRLEAFALNFR